MSSIKDKPLKKIVCDKRVTIDSLHNNKVKNINHNSEKINKLECKIENIQSNIDHNDIEKKIEAENELIGLKNKLNNFKQDEYIDYYLNNGLLLSNYYDNNIKSNIKNNDNNNKRSVLDLMKTEEIEKDKVKDDTDNDYNDLINRYMVNINDNYISNSSFSNMNMCKNCDKKLYIKNINSEIICENCGYTEKILFNLDSNSYKDPIRESTYFAYKRINHFNEWLAQFQAKETTDISEEIYTNIIRELKKDKNFIVCNVSYKLVRNTLKKLKYNKYYEHIPHIINIITGEKTPILDRYSEEQLRNMFKEMQQPFHNNCPGGRKNFLSYAYVLHKFCELLELDDLLIFFTLLKSREKLQGQDFIWKKICHDLKWQFIPSI